MNITITTTKLDLNRYDKSKSVRSDLIINDELIEMSTHKSNHGGLSTYFSRYTLTATGMRTMDVFNDIHCYKWIDHGKMRATEKALTDAHNKVLNNLANLLIVNDKKGY